MAYFNFKTTVSGAGAIYDLGVKESEETPIRYNVKDEKEVTQTVKFDVSSISGLNPDLLTEDDFIVTYDFNEVPETAKDKSVSGVKNWIYPPTFDKSYSNGVLTVTIHKGTWHLATKTSSSWAYENYNLKIKVRVYVGKAKSK